MVGETAKTLPAAAAPDIGRHADLKQTAGDVVEDLLQSD
jgi:hypothetical protein